VSGDDLLELSLLAQPRLVHLLRLARHKLVLLLAVLAPEKIYILPLFFSANNRYL
jgi:hypothetical protein